MARCGVGLIVNKRALAQAMTRQSRGIAGQMRPRHNETTIMSEPLTIIFGRRSIRQFAPGEVSEDKVRLLLEAAMAAPSAVGKDPWRFVVVRQPEKLKAMADVLPHGAMLASSAVGITVCGDLEVAHDGQISYLLQDCSAAIENILLAAHALDLGACWLGVHPREERMRDIKKLLNLPASVIPVSCIAVGHPGEFKESRSRYDPNHVHFEQW
jgi:nitroreductase